MSDVTIEDVKQLVEDLVIYAWPAHLPAISSPFPCITYSEALTLYGTDKPDTRFDWKVSCLYQVLFSIVCLLKLKTCILLYDFITRS